jgi:hypothetical protein
MLPALLLCSSLHAVFIRYNTSFRNIMVSLPQEQNRADFGFGHNFLKKGVDLLL